MKIEIWSDIICPFCYIGKRKFEAALDQFNDKEQLQIIWKSFQLMPELVTAPDKSLDEVLAEAKGLPLQEAHKMNVQATAFAKEAGLHYHMDKVIPANSLKAQQLVHFAKNKDKQNEAEEVLFRAYFTDGKNIDDMQTLISLGTEIGLDPQLLKTALQEGTFAKDVLSDIHEAQQIGITGVPFFVFNRKFALSGAQPSAVFVEALKKSFQDWQAENNSTDLDIVEGKTCSPDKGCE